MISLSSSPTLASKALHTPGGFLWWYVDIIDEHGNGLVLIWSFGLPFLPNYASKARSSNPQSPSERPSLVISVYKNFKLDCYLFQEFSQSEVLWEDSQWYFGMNHMKTTQDGLSISLSLPIPQTNLRLYGTIDLTGTKRQDGNRASQTAHEWVPILMPADASVNLMCGEEQYQFFGRAYHDHNSALHPLHSLNIQSWWWGRIALPDQELIWYSLTSNDNSPPIHLSISVSKDGTIQIYDEGNCECINLKKSIFGLSSPSSFKVDTPWKEQISIHTKSIVDDGPFYQRYIVHTKTQRGDGYGIAEQVVPDLVDGDWMRPLVQMRVAQSQRDHNSFWLPLFTGPKKGRWTRLIQQLYTQDLL